MEVIGVDNAEVGVAYSTLAGVLAGFAFAGLILVLTYRLGQVDQLGERMRLTTDNALALLFAAFLGLVLSSLSYALIAGETAEKSRASLEHVVAGAGFGTAGQALLLAVMELMFAIRFSLHAYLRFLNSRVAPLVVVLYVWAGAHEVGQFTGANWVDVVGLLCALGLLGTLVTVPRLKRPAGLTGRATRYLVALSLLVPFAGTLAIALIVALVPANGPLPTYVAAAALLVTLVSSLSFVALSGPSAAKPEDGSAIAAG